MEPKKLNRVAIIGAGTMGRRLAYGCLLGGKETRLFDSFPGASDKCVAGVRKLIADREAGGRLPQGSEARLMPLLSIAPTLEAAVKGVDLAIETIVEAVEPKREVFSAIDGFADPETLIGTNTSSIPGSWLASATKRPEKCFNFNVSGPDTKKCEVMPNPQSAPETMAAAMAFMRECQMIPVYIPREIMGYIGNRVWHMVKKEVLKLIANGYATPDIVDRAWMADWESDMGPCMLMDQVGLDTILHVEEIYWQASNDPDDEPPQFLRDWVAQGRLGQKSGHGFYEYPNPRFKKPGWYEGTLQE